MDLGELHEIQENEIEALKAIFMEDYVEVANQTPWKVRFFSFFCTLSIYIERKKF